MKKKGLQGTLKQLVFHSYSRCRKKLTTGITLYPEDKFLTVTKKIVDYSIFPSDENIPGIKTHLSRPVNADCIDIFITE